MLRAAGSGCEEHRPAQGGTAHPRAGPGQGSAGPHTNSTTGTDTNTQEEQTQAKAEWQNHQQKQFSKCH